MQSQNGDVQLSVTLSTKGLKSDAQKIKQEIQNTIGKGTGGKGGSIISDAAITKSTAKVDAMTSAIEKAQEQARILAEQIQEAGGVQVPTEEYRKMAENVEWLEKELSKANAQLDHMELTGEEGTSKYDKLANRAYEMEETLKNLKGEMQGMVDMGEAFTIGDPEEVAKLQTQYDAVTDKIALMKHEQEQASSQAQQTSRDEAALGNQISSTGAKGVSAFQKLFSILKRLRPHLNHTHKAMYGIRLNFMNILGAAVGIRSLYTLFGKLKSAVTEGVKNMAQLQGGNNETNKSISTLMTSLAQLKNALGAAFTPIITLITPALNSLINLIIDAVNVVSQFIALLTGASTWTKAKRVQQNYADSLKKTGAAAKDAVGSLAAFDDIDVLNQNKNDGGGAGTGVENMFETAEISDAIKDWLERLKKMWEEADFSELGAILGQKLKEALDSIPWDEIKKVAYKIGKSIATFINGFVEVEGLGYTLGKTFAEVINTAFTFLYGFVHNLHWDSIGKFIGEQFLGFVDYIDAELIGTTIGETLAGAIELAFNLIHTILEGDGFRKLGEKVSTLINTVFEKMGEVDPKTGMNAWQKLGDTLTNSIHGVITAIVTALKKIKWEEVGQAIADLITGINWAQIGFDLASLANAIIDALVTSLFAVFNGLTSSSPMVRAIVEGLAIAAGIAALAGISIPALTMRIGKVTIAAVLAWELGFNIGQELGKLLAPDDKSWYIDWTWDDILGDPQAALDGFKAWWQDIWNNVSEAAYEIFFEPFEPNGELTLEGFFAGWDTYMESVGWLFTSNWVQEFIKFVKGLFGIHSPSTVFEGIGKDVMKGMFNGISSMINSVVNLFTILKTNIMTVIDDWKKKLEEAWTNIKKFATETWAEIKKTIEEKVNAFKTSAEEKITEFKTNIETFWGSLKKATEEKWNEIKDAIETPVKTFKENVEEKVNKFKEALVTHWTTLKTNTLEKWNQIKQGIINVFVAIKEGIKAPINGIITFVESMVNSVIDGINFLIDKLNVLVDMANKLPGGGLDLGVLEHLNHIEIPKLAQGAVIPPNREFLATLGDQRSGMNIEAPLDTIKEAFADVVGNMEVQNTGYSVMQLDGQTFAKLIVPYVISELNRQGMNVKVLEAT